MTQLAPKTWQNSFLSATKMAMLVTLILVISQASARAQWTTGTDISNTNSGNVGVGVSDPGLKLDVRGNATVFTSDARAVIGSYDLTSSAQGVGGGIQFGGKFHSNGLLAGFASISGVKENSTDGDLSSALVFTTRVSPNAQTERMRITSAGNIGIGTTSPAKKLHVFGSNSQVMVDRGANSSGNYALVNFATNGTQKFLMGMNSDSDPNVDKLSLFDLAVSASTPVMTFTGGNVGIGTSSPTTKLHVVGDISVTGNIAAKYQDLAEWVESSQELSAGTVVVLDQTRSNHVVASSQAYDTGVAGVISLQPGITLGEKSETKVLVATTGRVKVKVDATSAPIHVGDLLVTSDVAGVAKKSEPLLLGGVQIHRPGTLIGKALESLEKGTGEILVLLSLQ